MNRNVLWMILPAVLMLCCSGRSSAGEIDILVNKLVQKGVLSAAEGQIVLDETKQEVAKQNAKVENWALPDWVQKMKMKGDFRLRYQYERRKTDTEGRERGRIRYRLGLESKIAERFKVGAGLASGGSGARSTNQTFGDNLSSGGDAFDTPDIRLDYAYAEYRPFQGVEMVGGKFERKKWLWLPTDMLWDGDINPEGGSIHMEKSLASHLDGFFNSGVWLLDHKDQVDKVDPFLAYFQGGVSWGRENLDAKLAATYYNFNGVQGSVAFDDASGANSNTYEGTGYKYDYDSFSLGGEFGVKELFGGLPLKVDDRIAVFGEYVYNVDPSELDVGWATGVKFGHSKVKERGSWQGKYIYVWLGKDAWLDALPDSDRYDPGRTDVRSHEGILEYALSPNVVVGVDYYYNQRIKASKNHEHLLQLDLNFKF